MWRFVLAATDGTPIAELNGASGRTVTWNLNDSATAGFTIPGTVPVAQQINETASDLLVYSPSNSLRFRGRFGSSGDDVSAAGHTSNFSAVDYRGFLARRFIWPGSTISFPTPTQQTAIAWQLIADSQAQPGGNLGITDGSIFTGIARTMLYTIGDEIQTRITEMGNLVDGFDWEIGPDLVFRTFYPYRGNINGINLAYGAEIVSFRQAVDTSIFANAVRYSGDTSLTPATAYVPSFGAAGRWELQVGDTTILDQTFLYAKTAYELAKDSAVAPSYDVTLRPGYWTPEKLWLGDIASLSLHSGRITFDGQLRVTAIALTIGDDGGETVVVTFGGVSFLGAPTPDQAATARAQLATQTTTTRSMIQSILQLQRR